MQFNFSDIIAALNNGLPQSDNFAFAMSRNGRVPADYLLNTFLPNENRSSYHVDGGSLTVTPTMIGQVPMDSPYPPFGAMSSTQFLETTTKLGGSLFFPEKTLRELQQTEDQMISLGVKDGRGIDSIMGSLEINMETGRGDASTVYGRRINALIDLSSMIRQSHWDRLEWMRGRVLFTGKIDWTFMGIPLKVDYDIPAENILAKRTGANSYTKNSNGTGGTTSVFWDDIRFLSTKFSEFKIVMNDRTWLGILNNGANQIQVIENSMNRKVIVRTDPSVVNYQRDVRDRVEIIVYNKSGSILKKVANTDQGVLEAVQFVPDGQISVIGTVGSGEIELMQGASEDPTNAWRLGYTHIAPTVEGQNRPGIWAQIYTPEAMPMQVVARTAANVLPALLNPKRVIILSTEMP